MSSNPPVKPGAPVGAATTSQPFWTSKTFWTLAVAAAFNFLNFFHVIAPTTNVVAASNSVLVVLGMIFRWQADQPLSV